MSNAKQTQIFGRVARAALLMAGVSVATLSAASARELRFAVGLPEGNYNFAGALDFAETIDATTDVTVRPFTMALLSLGEIPGGLRDGLADIGYVLFPYFPAEFSEANLVADLALLSTSGTEALYPGPAMVGASIEYIMLNCPECQNQFRRMNMVYLNGGTTTDYGLVCNTPVPTLADIRGKRIRTGATDQARFVEYFGGTNVALGGNEIYDALNTGNVDCSTNAPENLVSLRYIEIADYFTHQMPGSMFAGQSTASMNRDTWIGLDEDQRRAFLNAAARLSVVGWNNITERNASGLQAFIDAGKTVFEPSEEDLAAFNAFVEQDIEVVRARYVREYGLSNVDEKIELISDLIEKWKGLTNEVGPDIDALTQLYIDEIYSKVDVATYGIQ